MASEAPMAQTQYAHIVRILRYHGPDDPARRVIDCQTFIRNVGVLSSYLAEGEIPS